METEGRRAYLAALRLLGRRPLSVQELTRKLLRRGLSAEAAAEAVTRLLAEGALDDAAYARAYVHDRLLFHPIGKRGLQAELLRRGVPAEVVEEVLAGIDAEGEEELIRGLLSRRRATAGTTEEARRLGAWLLRRGFAPEAVRAVLGRGPAGGGEWPEC
ncbi:MAG: regulatory protein RecX [Bacillota bacterium]|nr:regulatory protein RecX [Bacillota bacterium]